MLGGGAGLVWGSRGPQIGLEERITITTDAPHVKFESRGRAPINIPPHMEKRLFVDEDGFRSATRILKQ